jgi:hypothetical protein
MNSIKHKTVTCGSIAGCCGNDTNAESVKSVGIKAADNTKSLDAALAQSQQIKTDVCIPPYMKLYIRLTA